MEKTCVITNRYSEIPMLQSPFTVIYTVCESKNRQITMSVIKEEKNYHTFEKCIVHNLQFNNAENLLKYFSENSICEGAWLNLLEDLNISYDLIDSKVSK